VTDQINESTRKIEHIKTRKRRTDSEESVLRREFLVTHIQQQKKKQEDYEQELKKYLNTSVAAAVEPECSSRKQPFAVNNSAAAGEGEPKKVTDSCTSFGVKKFSSPISINTSQIRIEEFRSKESLVKEKLVC